VRSARFGWTVQPAGIHPHPVFYFGCMGQSGHYLHDPAIKGRVRVVVPPDWPAAWGPHGGGLDGTLLAKGAPQVEGVAQLHHVDGWTALAFWDRSVDNRGGSNSVFVTRGLLDFDTMRTAAEVAWPQVFARLSFTVTNAAGDTV
jgi:hypothetical protein